MKSEAFFQSHPVFTREEYAESRTGSPRTVESLLRSHSQSGRITRVRRGLYVSSPAKRAEGVDPYLIASRVTPDAAVSHHAAFQFHGRSYSIWNQITFLTQSHARAFEFGPIQYVPLRPPASLDDPLGVGIETLFYAGGMVRVSSLERAMVDMLHNPAYGGGWEEIWRSLDMVEFFDLNMLVSYAIKLGSATTVARLGFYLSQHRERLFVEQGHLEELAAHAPKNACYMDTSRRSGRLVHPWNLIVPEFVLNQGWNEVA